MDGSCLIWSFVVIVVVVVVVVKNLFKSDFLFKCEGSSSQFSRFVFFH